MKEFIGTERCIMAYGKSTLLRRKLHSIITSVYCAEHAPIYTSTPSF